MTTPPADPRITELLDAIATTAPGHTTTWTNSGIEVAVYGQRRDELHTPAPGAAISVSGRIRPIHNASPRRGWERLYVDDVPQPDQGADFVFRVGASGSKVSRESH
ncbi:hypothetical protein AB1K54_14475 [Microbacterium sp. BWT-B31]|uniref:hypothetical protein n=1 Tax=Microbacterium sp. BWT-B31 TaxID=3232072 RepID=UPI0035285A77